MMLPRQSIPIAEAGGRTSDPFYRFLQDLERVAQASPGDTEALQRQIDKLREDIAEGRGDIGLLLGSQSVRVVGQLSNGNAFVSLQGDVDEPGPTFVYGTTAEGQKGWFALADGLLEGEGVALSVDATGRVTFGLAPLPDTGGGTLQKLERDQYGRVSGTSAATTDDLNEGAANLYFTDERAQDAVGAAADDTGDVQLVYETSPARRLWARLSTAISGLINSALQPGDNVSELTNDAGYVDADDARLTDAREWTASTVSQAEAEAGTATIRRAWTAQRVHQAVRAAVLTGLSTTTNAAITAADSVLSALGKLQAQVAGKLEAIGIRALTSISGYGGFIGMDAPESDYGIAISRSGHACIFNASSFVRFAISNVPVMDAVATGFRPTADNVAALGASNRRFTELFAANGSINTSDAREKTAPRDLTEAELAAAADIARLPCIFQWLHAIEEKGEEARLHASPTVQAVIAAMEAHGLDPFRYGFVCFDQWDEQPEVRDEWPDEYDDEGTLIREAGSEVTQEYRPAGDRYSLRPTELAHFVLRGLAHRQDELERRLAAVESP